MPNEPFIAICPFFQKSIGRNLYCEAQFNDPDIDKSVLRIEFNSPSEMRKFAKERCCTEQYLRCHVAAFNLAFYEQKFHQQRLVKMCLGKEQVNKKIPFLDFFSSKPKKGKPIKHLDDPN